MFNYDLGVSQENNQHIWNDSRVSLLPIREFISYLFTIIIRVNIWVYDGTDVVIQYLWFVLIAG